MMSQTIVIAGATFYLTIAACLFTQWAEIVQRHIRQRSQLLLLRIFLAIVTVLWPIVVPIAYLELLIKVKKDKEKMVWQAERSPESFSAATTDDSLLL
jgi:hypothetical protein